jgi:hypothetical protein
MKMAIKKTVMEGHGIDTAGQDADSTMIKIVKLLTIAVILFVIIFM